MRNPRFAVFVMGLICSLNLLAMAEARYAAPPQSPAGRSSGPADEVQAKMEREREKKLNEERFAKLKRDTDKLLALATELKAEVEKANEHTLSLDVVKKAEEIEKLARNVREKMRDGY